MSRTLARGKYLLRIYGITLKTYTSILKKQGGGCWICGRPPKTGKSLAVDHDHVSLAIRGLLCYTCNHRVIGRHRDPELLEKAAKYLRQNTGLFIPVKKKKRRRKKKCQ